jgi:hypothetical protein
MCADLTIRGKYSTSEKFLVYNVYSWKVDCISRSMKKYQNPEILAFESHIIRPRER